MSVRIDGLTEALDATALLPQAFRDVVSETLDAGAGIIFVEADRRVPIREGTLEQSLGLNRRADGLEIAIGSGDFKAKFLEFGTNDTPAEPFLYPAYKIGAKYIRAQMRDWAEEAGQRARFRNKVSKKAKAE